MTQAVAQVRNVVSRTGFANPLTLGVLVTDSDYVKVYSDNDQLVEGTDYIITGIGDAEGVDIEIIGAEDPDNYVGVETFTAFYDPTLDQPSDLSSGGVLGRSFELGLDQQNRRLQAVNDKFVRALKLPVQIDGDAALPWPPVDGYTLVWNAATQSFDWAPGGEQGEQGPPGADSALRSITSVGAACDGVTLDDDAWDQVAALGGQWYHPGGVSLVSRTVQFNLPGTQIIGPAAGYDNSFQGAKITAAAGFVGDDVVRFGDGTLNMRSVGMRNIEINGGVDSDAHGLTVERGYDACMFENVTALKIGSGRCCFNFTAELGFVGQTIVGTNLFGIHREASNGAPAFRLYGQQECTFINCKGWGASSTAGAPDSTSDVWEIDSSSGITLLNCSAVATVEHGFSIKNTTKTGAAIVIINPTIENVGKPLRIFSEMALTFAGITGISPVPAVGDIVSQPADGSVATGRVWFATALGIYVTVLTGEFALAPVYNAGGANLGTLNVIRREAPKDVSFFNPRFYGSVTGVTGESLIEHAKEFDIDWRSNNGVTPPLTIQGSEASGEVRTTDRDEITNATDYTKVTIRDQNGADAEVLTSDWYALNTNGVVLLPTPKKGKRVRVTHDLSEATAASFQLNPGAGVSIDRGTAGATMYLSGQGSSVELWAVSSTEWRIASFTGAISVNGHGYRMTDRGVIEMPDSSPTIGFQTFGYTYANSNVTAVRTLTLTALGTTSPLATNGGYKFTRTHATHALRIDPNAADEIVGSGGVGKYLQIDTVGATVELRARNGKWYVFGDAASYSFEP